MSDQRSEMISDATISVWELDKSVPARFLEDHTAYIRSVAISADGNRPVSQSGNSTIWVWELDGSVPARTLEGHIESVRSVALSVDGKLAVKLAVSGFFDNTVRVWDISSSECFRVFTCDIGVRSCAWRSNIRVAGTKGGQVHFFRWEE